MGGDLQCPLPFFAEEYRRDFDTPASMEEFNSCLPRPPLYLSSMGDATQKELPTSGWVES